MTRTFAAAATTLSILTLRAWGGPSADAADPRGRARPGNPLTGTAAARPRPLTIPSSQWLFAGFQDSGPGSEHLQLSVSDDGITWTNNGNVYAAPPGNGVRDPSILCLDHVYYAAYTAGVFGAANYFQICKSSDLVNWTYLCDVSTQGVSTGGGTWAPDWFVDRDGKIYLYVTCSQPGGAWRAFYSTATTLDLTTWTAFQPVGGDMASRGAIDAHAFRVGNTYYLLYRNYGASGSTDCIELARGTSPTAFSLYRTGDWAGWGSPREGPSLVNLGGSSWRIYFNNLSVFGDPNYYSDSSDDLLTWSPPAATERIAGHGTVLPLTTSATEPFDVFLFSHGLSGVDPAVDFDHDGVTDLMEFLLDGDPVVADANILPSICHLTSNGISSLVYSFVSVANLGSVTWTVETSSDLTAWTAAVAGRNGVNVVSTPLDTNHNQIVVTVPDAGGPPEFARLRVAFPGGPAASAAH